VDGVRKVDANDISGEENARVGEDNGDPMIAGIDGVIKNAACRTRPDFRA
jgi:hypothetical protein